MTAQSVKNSFTINDNNDFEDLEYGSYSGEIVISGFSGHLPESSNIEEFRNNLYNGVDMINDEERRWPKDMIDIPVRTAKLKEEDLANFDHIFFGVHQKQAEAMDPLIRMLLEATHEAFVDSGYNPRDLRGTRTGVYIGVSGSEQEQYLNKFPDLVNEYGLLGSVRTMFANRLSYTFDLRGPSHAVDTACSSSLYAMRQAFADMRSGHCDAAVVAGANLILRPTVTKQFYNLKMLSPEGNSRVFDETGNGYVRADACVVMFLQKAKDARRVYSTILNIRTNTDGAKEQGITYPSGLMQKKLIEETFKEINLNPLDVVYVEAHGTGTVVGDPEEVNGICDIFCKDRMTPLLIGSLKSNMGHPEPASGVCSVAKMLIAMEEGIIPANLNYNKPNPKIYGLIDGRMKVVVENTPWNGGIISLNNFGFGGTNVHAILKSNPKMKAISPLDGRLPRLAVVSGRTVEAVETLLKDIEVHRQDEEYFALINEVHSKNIPLHNFRGYAVVSKDEVLSDVVELSEEKRPVWFVYSGMGSQWAHMAKELMQIDVFRNSIYRCADALRPEGIDLIDVMTNMDESSFDILHNFISITAMQIALTDVLIHLEIIPDGFVGHSVGELGCAYADGGLTLEQTVLASYFRGRCIVDTELISGMMASVGLSWEKCLRRLPEDILPACNNSADNVTISGPTDAVNKFVETLKNEGIFAKTVNVSGRAFHSKYIADAGPLLKNSLDKIIPNPKDRTDKWISSSIPEAEWNSSLSKKSSADYHVNNLLSPVYFHEAVQHIPKNAICIEVAPHGLLQAILRRSLGPDVTNISLVKRNHEKNVQFLLSNIGKLYAAGAQPVVKKLFPPVSFPVGRGTPMLNSKIIWDHSQKCEVPFAGVFFNKTTTSGETVVEINLNNEEDAFLAGHIIDGRVLYPATGYIMLAWKQFATTRGTTYNRLPVVFEDVTFHRATILPANGSVKLGVNMLDGTGKFEICEGGSLVASGFIRAAEDIEYELLPLNPLWESKNGLALNANDIYKELRLRGYDYSGRFRGIVQVDPDADTGKLEWIENWVSFMDTILHFSIIETKYRELYLPKRINRIVINPEKHLELAAQYCTDEGGKSIFPVYMYKDINVVKSGGVEIRGIEVSLTPKRQNSHVSPVLEKYTFVPNLNSFVLSDDLNTAKQYAVTCSVQLAIENCQGALKIKTAEVLLGTKRDLLSPFVKQVIENEPVLGSDAAVVVAESAPELEQMMNDAEIRLVVKDIEAGAVEFGCHLYIAKDICEHPKAELIFRNLKESIKEDGFILLEEPIKEISATTLFDKLGLTVVSSQVSSNRKYLLVRPVFDISSKKIQVVNVTEKNFDWLEDLKLTLRTAEDENKLVYIVCQGEELFGAVGLMNCIKNEAGGKFARLFFIQDTNAPIFSTSNPFYMKQIAKNLIINILKDGSWGTFRHLKLDCEGQTRLVEHAYVNNLIKGNLSSFKWIEGPFNHNRPDPNSLDELCTIYYAPLNFRDVMLSSGKLADDDTPLEHGECVLGIEFSGRDSKGNRVMSIVPSKSLATSCVVKKSVILSVPDSWTLADASTTPTAYVTVFYGLVVRGKMKKGESILIHAGSGGVGQAAISVALKMGLTVYTTVGSQQKRDFLKETFPELTDRHIGNSRDCSFEQMIMRETQGKGVDLVLNSLSDDKFKASVRCLGFNGRFIEIGKFDIANNTALGTSVFLKNTSFHGVFLDYIWSWDDETTDTVLQLMRDGIESGAVRPLPITVFGKEQVEEAFRYMASGKHIGKVVLKIREEEEENQVIPALNLIPAMPRTYMYSEKTYVVVGGLGGLGLELINWLISRGAKNIVASSRNGIQTGYQSLMERRWKKKGVNFVVDKSDVTTKEGTEQLLKQAIKLGPVGGIFNLAAVLHDALFDDQQEGNFQKVCLPKINATKCLDAASRSLCPSLDYFICFSSVSCGRGNIAQTNYGMANSAMERICEARQAAGYPATAIQWGAVGDTGLIIEHLGDNNTNVGGTLPQRMSSCLQTMDLFMKQPHPVLASMVVAEKRKVDSAGQLSIAACVANILGIKNIQKVPNGLSLTDLGLDSLMGTEIKQTLERNYDLVLSVQEIKQLTFGKLLEYDKEAKTSSRCEEISEETELVPDDEFTKNLIPKEVLVHLPSNAAENSQQRPLFVIHAIEGFVDAIEPVAAELNCPVWGLQCTENVSQESIEDMAKFYISQIKTVQSKGPYIVAGYSYGTVIACEMARQLETEFKEAVSLVLLDGSPQLVKMKFQQKRLFISEIKAEAVGPLLLHFATRLVGLQRGLTVMKELDGLLTLEEKLRRYIELLHKTTQHDQELIRIATDLFSKKFLICEKYRVNGRIRSDVNLIKCSTKDFKISEDFQLSEFCEGEVKVHVVDGNHRTFIMGESARKVAEIIQKIVDKV
ncbi:fatty acid synthase-like [Lutzomyia longipalpis]|uniref:fatty acid synthase-like n=1 Tax=Lutzomyia longipalpis TaxID=7200 RepID=UPI0024838BBB|nr:fatty acid synthase-like [Lutzomyia longipalpis]XP_055691898.1 fatty acid synthase-like [Lutzomyia longipalpis]